MPYLGKSPSQGVRARYQFTPNAGTTSLSGADANGSTMTFTDGNYVDVYLNGVMLKAGVDYVTTTANTIGSLSATVASDVVDVIVYDTFSLFGGTLEGNVKVNNGTFNVTGAGDFDSTLNVDGAITSSAGATISTTGQEFQLILTSTDADALQGPRLKLYRNSSSPANGDATGEFTFVGRNDNSQDVDYFQIRTDATDVSDGSEDATVHFFHMRDGTIRSSLTFAPTETIFNDDHRDLDFRVESDTVTNALFVQGSDGNVGIGVGDPDHKLEILGGNGNQLKLNNGSERFTQAVWSSNDSMKGSIWYDSTNTDFVVNTQASVDLVMQTGGANERMRIDSSGNATFTGSVTANNIVASGAASSFNSGGTNTVATFTSTDSVAEIQMIDNNGTAGISAEGSTFQVRPSGGAAKLSVAADGQVTIADGDLVIGTSGHGISFAASSDASGMTNELLDDYEEGTWTATLTGATSAPSSSQTQTGTYTKVGRLCTAEVYIQNKNTTGASGGLKVTGLPFTAYSSGFGSYISYAVANYASGTINTACWVSPGTDYLVFYENTDSGIWDTTQIVAGSLKYLALSITYQTT